MNTKPSKITLKKQDLPRRNFSTQSQARISRELSLSRLLYVDFPKNSREILMEFFRNAQINLQPVYRPPPLNENRRGGGGGVCTQPAINLRLQKGIALLTLPVNNNLHTCNLHCLLYSPLYSNIIRSLQAILRVNINYGLIKQHKNNTIKFKQE